MTATLGDFRVARVIDRKKDMGGVREVRKSVLMDW